MKSNRRSAPAVRYGSSPLLGTAFYLRAAVCVTVVLGSLYACQSPVSEEAAGPDGKHYVEGILARSLSDKSLGATPIGPPTVNKGVSEPARVDEPGPAGTGPSTGGAIVPPSTTSTATSLGLNNTTLFEEAQIHRFATSEPARLGQNEGVVHLALEDVLARALKHSLAIKVEGYNPGIRELQITEAAAVFDPVIFGQSIWVNQDQPVVISGTLNGVNWNNAVGVRKLLPTGGTAQFSIGDTYRDFQTPGLSFPPPPKSFHSPNINLTLSQPLLRGWGSEANYANIYIAQRDRRIALATFRRQVITTIANTEEAYHNLVLAYTGADIQERLLQNTEDTFKRVKERGIIDADLIAIKQAQSAYESRQADLIRAKTNVRDASDKLKALINDPELELGSNLLILPSDRPIDVPLAFNVAEQVDTALKMRTELQEARLNAEKTDVAISVARNELLPKADVTLSVQSNGQVDNGLDAAFVSTFDSQKLIDYSAGIKFEVPIGNRGPEATLRRRQIERSQAITQMFNAAQQVIIDVKLNLRDLLTSYEEIQARQAARISAGETLNALIQREQVERLTPEFLQLKLDSQQRLANAEISELQARVNYNLAIMKLEQAKGTLLEYNHIAIGPAPETGHDQNNVRFLGQTYEFGK